MTRILPSYDEAQERLEELSNRLKYAESELTRADNALIEARRSCNEALSNRNKAQICYIAHLEKMVAEAAAEKAVRGV